jgi:hypothetical protein
MIEQGALRGNTDGIGKLIGTILLVVAVAAVGLAAVGAYAAYAAYGAVVAAGAGKAVGALAAVGAFIAAPVATLTVLSGVRKGFKALGGNSRYKAPKNYTPPVSMKPYQAPTPAPAPAPSAPADGTPAVFVDALKQLEEMKPEDRKKYLETLRDHFPSEVETLHKYDEQMALKQEAKVMKPITLGTKAPSP